MASRNSYYIFHEQNAFISRDLIVLVPPCCKNKHTNSFQHFFLFSTSGLAIDGQTTTCKTSNAMAAVKIEYKRYAYLQIYVVIYE
jgi:hypothetical protein